MYPKIILIIVTLLTNFFSFSSISICFDLYSFLWDVVWVKAMDVAGIGDDFSVEK